MTRLETLFTRQRSDVYNCADFVVEAAQVLLQKDISHYAGLVQASIPLRNHKHLKAFQRQRNLPKQGLALFHYRHEAPHVGLVWKYRILHLSDLRVFYVPLEVAALQAKRISFYTF